MKIAIAGAGAMGGRFGYMLFKAGYDVTLIDQWVPHVEAIREHGFKINLDGEDICAKIPIFFPEEVAAKEEKYDLIVLYTKSMQLDSMLETLGSVVTHEDTFVICLLNGIGHEEVVKKYVPITNILLGNTMWTAGLVGPGKIKLHSTGHVDFSELHPNGKEMAKKAVDAFNDAGLNAVYAEDVYFQIYRKATLNGVMNSLCTILDANMHNVGMANGSWQLMEGIVEEFAAVAAAEGVKFDKEEVFESLKSCFDKDGIGAHFPSMHQDLIGQHRLTEIDSLNGYIAQKGKEHGIPTPICACIAKLIHCKEDLLKAT